MIADTSFLTDIMMNDPSAIMKAAELSRAAMQFLLALQRPSSYVSPYQ